MFGIFLSRLSWIFLFSDLDVPRRSIFLFQYLLSLIRSTLCETMNDPAQHLPQHFFTQTSLRSLPPLVTLSSEDILTVFSKSLIINNKHHCMSAAGPQFMRPLISNLLCLSSLASSCFYLCGSRRGARFVFYVFAEKIYR